MSPLFGNTVAVGIIEINGYVAAAAAVEAMEKASDARFVGHQRSGGVAMTAIIEGEISAVQFALEAGEAAARKADADVKSTVLVHPDPQVGDVLSLLPTPGTGDES